jgi:hypothetical protein
MARKPSKRFDEKELTRGQLRKLNALRKSLGDEIAERAFGEWFMTQNVGTGSDDRNARQIAEALQPLVDKNQLRIPRGGYKLRRGRGRVIVERPDE